MEGAIHTFLSDSPSYVASTFLGESRLPGQLVEGVRHEDLQQLSFEDNRFDLVLSAEVHTRALDFCVCGGKCTLYVASRI